jgi:two-component system sensor histidine kinase DegS
VQEACENAIHHGHCVNIKIYGSLNSTSVDLTVEDDGIGFEVSDQLELDTLLSNNHFGLAGMMERAYLIGGELNLQSNSGTGTKIQLKAILN